MPTYRKSHKTKPWRARAHRVINGNHYDWSLGYYATQQEALDVEQVFHADVVPRTRECYGRHQRAIV